MNDTSWLWITGAVLVGAVLLLVLGGGPAEAPVATPSLSEGSTVQTSGALTIAPAAEAAVTASAPAPIPAKGCGCQGTPPVSPAADSGRGYFLTMGWSQHIKTCSSTQPQASSTTTR